MGGRLLHSDQFQICRRPLFFIIIWLVNNDIVVLLSAVVLDALVCIAVALLLCEINPKSKNLQ